MMRFQMIRPAALSPTGNSRMAGSYADLILGCLHREIRRLFHRTVESEGQEHMEALRREIGAAPAEDWSQKKNRLKTEHVRLHSSAQDPEAP
ncbi:MAG: hypothetical protein L6W00_11905 [Lentisphaeria bacterium]|nr:MAG: hypothetical protein L6W00_11905 [Lentisphaeria bacterium]